MKYMACVMMLFLVSGCASNMIVKNCYDMVSKDGKKVNGEVCKSTMPWADFEEE